MPSEVLNPVYGPHSDKPTRKRETRIQLRAEAGPGLVRGARSGRLRGRPVSLLDGAPGASPSSRPPGWDAHIFRHHLERARGPLHADDRLRQQRRPPPAYECADLDAHLLRHARRCRISSLFFATPADHLRVPSVRHRHPERLPLLSSMRLPGLRGLWQLLSQRAAHGPLLRPLRPRPDLGQHARPRAQYLLLTPPRALTPLSAGSYTRVGI
jgi:hypothetical protein